MPSKPLSWNEMRARAVAFSSEWASATSEQADKQTFWNEFFEIFGVSRKRVGSFEFRAKRTSTGNLGWIDMLWAGVVAVEHKSAGHNLDAADDQNLDYLDDLEENDVPQLLISCDFQRFRVTDLESRQVVEFGLTDLADHLKVFGPIAGYRRRDFKGQEEASIKAAELLAKVYTELEDNGYQGHDLAVLAVRLLFVMFADDTGVFETNILEDLIELRTSEDGSDLGRLLVELFDVLNTPEDGRQKNLDEDLARFPYINGGLFKDPIRTPVFNGKGRAELLNAIRFNWSSVSPAIFGSIFQSVKDTEARRSLGSHYTTEANILRLIGPLFLDDLQAEFQAAHNNSQTLRALQDKMASLTFLDPAAGCGNFLIVTYRELRRLELDILVRLRELADTRSKRKREAGAGQLSMDARAESKLHVGQFYAIEIDEFPAQIAQTAMYLIDHLENMRLSQALGEYYARFPIQDEAHVAIGNACRLDWNTVIPAQDLNYILGNPPFIGRQFRTATQADDMRLAHEDAPGHGPLDYVTAWHAKSVALMRQNPAIRAGLVSTNSICQGENVGLLWPRLLDEGVTIDFAVRTFKWGNEARNKAAVHCVIVGFSRGQGTKPYPIYEEERDRASGTTTLTRLDAENINPYLVAGPSITVSKRRQPLIAGVPACALGSMPNDGGGFKVVDQPLDQAARDKIQAKATKAADKARAASKAPLPAYFAPDVAAVRADGIAEGFLRPVIGSEEAINGDVRWGFWLATALPQDLRQSPILRSAVDHVRSHRLHSDRETTKKLAATPARWGEERQPSSRYIAIPEVSSENRDYIPLSIQEPDVVATNTVITVRTDEHYWFGVLQSAMHMAWMRTVGGRLKSDYRYSPGLVYNTFPFPEGIPAPKRKAIEDAARGVLDARAAHPRASLADLYDPLSMPASLRRAHDALDVAVDAAYTRTRLHGDTDRLAVLFQRYSQATAGLLGAPTRRSRG